MVSFHRDTHTLSLDTRRFKRSRTKIPPGLFIRSPFLISSLTFSYFHHLQLSLAGGLNVPL
jgi:hypothetical protein